MGKRKHYWRQSFTFYYLQEGWLMILLTPSMDFDLSSLSFSSSSSSSSSSYSSSASSSTLLACPSCRHGRTVGGRGTGLERRKENKTGNPPVKCQGRKRYATSKQGTVFFFFSKWMLSLHTSPPDSHAFAPSGKHALSQSFGVVHLRTDLDGIDLSLDPRFPLLSLAILVVSGLGRAF